MKGIIFAAGIGSRLKPFTDYHPKALAPVGGVPAIDRVIRRMLEAGVDGLVINVHHFADQIKDHLSEIHIPGVTIEVSDESNLLLDTAGGLAKMVRENNTVMSMHPEEPIVVHNADIMTDAPLNEMLEHHELNGADATLLVDPARTSSRAFLFKDGFLHGWKNFKTGETKPELINTETLTAAPFGGVHILRRKLLDDISAKTGTVLHPWSITDFYIDTCRERKYAAFTPAGKYLWHDIGTPEKLQAASEAFTSYPT